MQSLVLEITRQALRLLGVYLVAKGLPQPIADALNDPAIANAIAIGIVYTLSEGGWIASLVNRYRKRPA